MSSDVLVICKTLRVIKIRLKPVSTPSFHINHGSSVSVQGDHQHFCWPVFPCSNARSLPFLRVSQGKCYLI